MVKDNHSSTTPLQKKNELYDTYNTYNTRESSKIQRSIIIDKGVWESAKNFARFIRVIGSASRLVQFALVEYMKSHASELPVKASFTLALPQPKEKASFGMECELFKGDLQSLMDQLETIQRNDQGYQESYVNELTAPWRKKIRKKILSGAKLARKTSDKEFHRFLVTCHIATMNEEDSNNIKVLQIKNLEKRYVESDPEFHDLNSKWLAIKSKRDSMLNELIRATEPDEYLTQVQKEELLESWGMGKKDLDESWKKLQAFSKEREEKYEEVERLKDQLAIEYWGAS